MVKCFNLLLAGDGMRLLPRGVRVKGFTAPWPANTRWAGGVAGRAGRRRNRYRAAGRNGGARDDRNPVFGALRAAAEELKGS